MAQQLCVYKFQYPAIPETPENADIVKRILTVGMTTADGREESGKIESDLDQPEFTIKVPEDSLVALSLVHVDDADNVSPPSEFAFKAADTQPPSRPGEFGHSMVMVGEEDLPETPETPEPDAEPEHDETLGEIGEGSIVPPGSDPQVTVVEETPELRVAPDTVEEEIPTGDPLPDDGDPPPAEPPAEGGDPPDIEEAPAGTAPEA